MNKQPVGLGRLLGPEFTDPGILKNGTPSLVYALACPHNSSTCRGRLVIRTNGKPSLVYALACPYNVLDNLGNPDRCSQFVLE
jgi:hypothetical protein